MGPRGRRAGGPRRARRPEPARDARSRTRPSAPAASSTRPRAAPGRSRSIRSRVLARGEWDSLARGLEQRLLALDAFVRDVYGPQRIVAEGVVPARVLGGAEYYEPLLTHLRPPGGQWITVAGFDVVRDEDGALAVLEDNLRTPSGIAYAMAAREAVGGRAGAQRPQAARRREQHAAAAGRAGGRHAAGRAGRGEPGRRAAHRRPHEQRPLGARVARPGARRRARGARRPVPPGRPAAAARDDAPGRRRLPAHERRPRRLGRRGSCCRRWPWARWASWAPGTGVADDKLVHSYVKDMVASISARSRPSPPCARSTSRAPGLLAEALDRFEQLVIKPRAGHGGIEVVICPHAWSDDVEAARGL